ncbi:hypothetical protein OIU76_002842 [Salix suchowensis]|nr:hypothetical protein OIU76_002842 [Salix suchowensis]
MDAMTEVSAECEEWIGRSQQTVTVSPKKLKAAVHKLSEAEKENISPLKVEEHYTENLEPHKTSRSKVKILGGVIPSYRHWQDLSVEARKASFLSRVGTHKLEWVIWGENTAILDREIDNWVKTFLGEQGRRRWMR